MYQVIAQKTNGHELIDDLVYIKRCLTLTEAKKIADKMWIEYDKNPNYQYGQIGIEGNEYEKRFGNWDLIHHIRTYYKLKNGNWD